MELGHQQMQSQQQTLSQSMAESLAVLQMPLAKLNEYVSERALENPVLDVAAPEMLSFELPRSAEPEDAIWEAEESASYPARDRHDRDALTGVSSPSGSFSEMLRHQMALDRRIPADLLPLCSFLVDCLDRRGYLNDPLELLAEIANTSVENMTQALYVLQEMTPTGVGARSLQECLILQLVKTADFNASTLKLIQEGLELLAANNYRAISRMLKLSDEETRQCCSAIRRLNPIPSRGYDTGDPRSYVIPEAEVLRQGEQLIVRYNDSALPRVSINPDYRDMLKQTSDPELSSYLRQHIHLAGALIHELNWRKTTIVRVLECLVSHQREFFRLGFEALTPLVLKDVAEELDLNPSTVGRAVRGKYIVTPQGTIELKQLFSVRSSSGGDSSAAAVKERIKALVASENKEMPLSDEKLCEALQALGVPVSRRTVAKYRDSLGILPASRRRIRQ